MRWLNQHRAAPPKPMTQVSYRVGGVAWAECGHCGEILKADVGDRGYSVVNHQCPDGHVEDRFPPCEGISDDDFEKYRASILEDLS